MRSDPRPFIFTEPPHVLDLRPGGLLLKSCEEGTSLLLTSGSLGDPAPSARSDSGLSVASQGQRRGVAKDGHTQTGKPVVGSDFQIALPLLEVMTELAAQGRGDTVAVDSGLGVASSAVSSCERESDAPPATAGLRSSSTGAVFQKLPETQTDSWIYRREHVREGGLLPLVAPTATARGISSREAGQRGAKKEPANNPDASSDPEEEDLTSITADADESIERLNQLIQDLDPTFVPVAPRGSSLSRSTSLHANGFSHEGKAQQTGERKQEGNAMRRVKRAKFTTSLEERF